MIRTAFALSLPLFALSSPALADRPATAILWLGGAGGMDAAAQVDAALADSPAVAPISDPEAKRLLIEGGPATRVRERVRAGHDRFATLTDLPDADAMLGEAEEIALAGLTVGAACPQLIEIARLRMRFAELTHDEPRAVHAALLLSACQPTPAPEDAAAIARHPQPPGKPAQPLRIESDPPGADVYLDLKLVGQTPLDLAGPRRTGAFLDVERAGLRKVHRALDQKGGTLALGLSHDDGLAALIDHVREGSEAKEADCADLARRVGAAQLLAIRASRADQLDVRLLDASRATWVKAPAEIRETSIPTSAATVIDTAALLAYVAPPPPPDRDGTALKLYESKTVATAAAVKSAAPAVKPPVPAYKRWYTWVIGGVLVGGVVAYVIADHVGDDQITVTVTH